VQTVARVPVPEHRRTEYNEAETFFRDVARGLVAVDQPENVTAESSPAKALPRYNPSSRPNTLGI